MSRRAYPPCESLGFHDLTDDGWCKTCGECFAVDTAELVTP